MARKGRNGKGSKRAGGRSQNGKGAGRGAAGFDGGVSGPSTWLPSQTRDIHRFVRTVDVGNLTVPSTDGGRVFNIAFADLPAYTEFSALFDQYRLSRVDLIFTWGAASGTTSVTYPVLYIAADYDGSGGTPGSINDIMQRRHITASFNPTKTQYTFSYRPRVLMNIGVGGSIAYAELNPPGGWVDFAAASITYRGATAWIAGYQTGIGGNIRLEERITFDCCGLR